MGLESLRNFFEVNHLKQSEVAKYLGISRSHMSNVLHGEDSLHLTKLTKLLENDRGIDYLLEPMDDHGDFLSWRTQLNKRLKAIGQQTGKKGKILGKGPFSEISTYWARHTWATLAFQIGIPVDVVGQALGHSDRSHAITFTYINPDQRKVDEANRRLIDYVLGL